MKRDLVVISWDGKSRPHEAVDFDQEARFDLLTFDYSGRAGRLPAGAPNAQLLSRPTECKGQIYLEVARHLQSCAAQYEYVGLIDDDIIIKVSGINHLLHVARLLKLDSFAPALTHDSGYTYKHTLRMENILLHWVPWVEVMMPFYRQPLFMAPSAQYGISISGWGVDKYLLPLFQKITGMNRAAVINAVAATHMRAATSGKKIYSNGRTAEDEVAVVGQWCLDFIAECHPHLADTDWYRSTFKVALERQAARRSVRDEGRAGLSDLTFVIPAKNDPNGLTRPCVESALRAARSRSGATGFVLIADQSSEQERILDIFRSFRAANPSLRVDIVRCRKWLHYTGVFSLGLTAAKTGDVFFLSNDMIMTPSFLRAVAEVADAVPDAGIVRGTSPYVDSHPEHTVKTQAPLRSIQDIDAFAEAIYRENGAKYAVDQLLSGDAVLVRRALIDAIGVLDTRFFGYFGDVDYGLRARRAGFRLVCAKGAWLYHFGEGHVRQEVKDGGVNLIDARNRRLQLVRQAGAALLDKWGVDLKAHFHGKSTVSLSFQEHVDLVSASGSAPLRFDLSDDFWRDVEFA